MTSLNAAKESNVGEEGVGCAGLFWREKYLVGGGGALQLGARGKCRSRLSYPGEISSSSSFTLGK